ncbi:hypothetical protein I3843_03G188500 [Carya illinoinensis]|nr:hypothetical protein I3843_03G188500 [Carya illinoinensis]
MIFGYAQMSMFYGNLNSKQCVVYLDMPSGFYQNQWLFYLPIYLLKCYLK